MLLLPGPQKGRRPDGGQLAGRALQVPRRQPVLPHLSHERRVVRGDRPGTNCIKIGLPGKLILSKREGLRGVIFS